MHQQQQEDESAGIIERFESVADTSARLTRGFRERSGSSFIAGLSRLESDSAVGGTIDSLGSSLDADAASVASPPQPPPATQGLKANEIQRAREARQLSAELATLHSAIDTMAQESSKWKGIAQARRTPAAPPAQPQPQQQQQQAAKSAPSKPLPRPAPRAPAAAPATDRDKLIKDIAELTTKNEGLEWELQQAKEQLAEKDRQIAGAKEQHRAAMEREMSKSLSASRSREAQVQQLEARLEAERAEAKKLAEEVQTARAEAARLGEENQRAGTSAKSELEKQIASLRRELSDATEQREKERGLRENAEREREAIAVELEKATQQAQQSESEVLRLKEGLRAQAEQFEEQVRLLEEAKAERDLLSQKAEEVEESFHEAQAELEGLKKEKPRFEERIRQQDRKIGQLTSEVQRVQGSPKGLEEIEKRHQAQIAEMAIARERMMEEAARDHVSQIEELKQALLVQKEAFRSGEEQHRQQLDKMQQEWDALHQKLQQAAKETEELRKKLEVSNATRTRMSSELTRISEELRGTGRVSMHVDEAHTLSVLGAGGHPKPRSGSAGELVEVTKKEMEEDLERSAIKYQRIIDEIHEKTCEISEGDHVAHQDDGIQPTFYIQPSGSDVDAGESSRRPSQCAPQGPPQPQPPISFSSVAQSQPSQQARSVKGLPARDQASVKKTARQIVEILADRLAQPVGRRPQGTVIGQTRTGAKSVIPSRRAAAPQRR